VARQFGVRRRRFVHRRVDLMRVLFCPSDRWRRYVAPRKEVLLKAVIQAIPAYVMSVFKLPKQVIKRITYAMTRYWWGDDDDQKHMH
jgi:hypothetical protein